jgi:hypothetical protein
MLPPRPVRSKRSFYAERAVVYLLTGPVTDWSCC